jgi:hypothetical protein
MKRLCLLIFIAILLPCLLFGQSKKHRLPPPSPPSKKDWALAEKHNKCFHQNKYSATQRRAFFPFSTADTIKLISFEAPYTPNDSIYEDNGKLIIVPPIIKDSIPLISPMAKNSFALNSRKVKEIKTLTIAGVNSLTNILYNYGYTPVKNLGLEIADPGANCYDPRNAILFIDGKGKVTQYLEICFGCQHHFWSSSKVTDIEYCDNKYELLRKYFIAQGVRYGADSKTIYSE